MFSTHLNLHAASPVLLPRPPDWEAHHHVPGQFTLPSDAEPWRPSAELQAFLDDGPPPALLSLGSMEHLAPLRARDLLLGAARHAGVRAIGQTKRSGEEGRDGALYFLPWAPHEALLPRCSMAVHHGGAGTTHAVLRAGIPAVIVPFIFEQQAWGDRLRAAGAAPKTAGFWKATAVSREEGVQRAMALLERLGP